MGNLTDEQITSINEALGDPIEGPLKKYIEIYKLEVEDPGDGHSDHWDCTKELGMVRGDTFMDNGYLEEWFRELEIPPSEFEILDDQLIDWEEYDED
jgi:hypothetical protein